MGVSKSFEPESTVHGGALPPKLSLDDRVSCAMNLRRTLRERDIIPFVGVYDVFSASLVARHCDGMFFSGFGFAASHYGLPDVGFIAWSDMVAFVQRVKNIFPRHFLMVDIDDGYCDVEVACHVVAQLEAMGVAGVILEDQRCPRRCGHFDGKQLTDLPSFLTKLNRVLAARKELFVVARTDANDPEEIAERVKAFAKTVADAILVDGLRYIALIWDLSAEIPLLFMFNQIKGGKSPLCSLTELKQAGVSLVNYSTPCLFAAQAAIEHAMRDLKERDGLLGGGHNRVSVKDCVQWSLTTTSSIDTKPVQSTGLCPPNKMFPSSSCQP